MKYIQVMTTTETKEQAQAIARHLVAETLAACVQITGPVESTYLWKGNVETAQEYVCAIKTRESLFAQVEAAIKKMHAYDIPEIVAFAILSGSAEYVKWLDESIMAGG